MRHPTQQILIMQKFFQRPQEIQTTYITQTPPQNINKTSLPALTAQPGKPKTENISRSLIDDPPSEYYSSDEQASNSEDDLN